MPVPVDDYVLLDPVEIEHKSRGGLVIAQRKLNDDGEPTEVPKIGRVVSFGGGKWDMSGLQRLIPGEKVKVGELWQIAKTADCNFTLHGREYYLTKMVNLMARFEETEVRNG